MPDSQTFLAISHNGKRVWYDPRNSHAATHIADTPQLKDLAQEVVAQSDITGDYVQFHADVGREVGTSDLVENRPGDSIMYARRLNRQEYTAFNKSQRPQPTSLVTVALEKKPDGQYELVSCWIGRSDSPAFPGAERETPDSKAYWAKHSLAWGRQEIQPGTETTVCPW